MPSESCEDVDKISETFSLLVLTIIHFIFTLPSLLYLLDHQ